ncbi:hypothetical protein NO559_07065 [Dasania sp. GY-MA-18]|uniref:DUF6868 domain-containing protein n=1 Tax=Dasania phycosphaerae TaxID=2950436 RepID=A0A9J6RKD7_9GAMM|nr:MULTISPECIES: hypothetical protein [Dasania]MCR8922527.1 hypothetical protein [Dasania sp. GY-MA-18]MCZ0864955.1 hypothetical protein [Dasania phycosphaerae]MCZ0868683.1 hypothetical protein [Dasania phycosphaerae]
MTIEQLSQLLLYSTLLNYGFLLLWLLMLSWPKSWLRRLHGVWFNIKAERFDLIHYQLMGAYKLLILIFNFVPYLALKMLF